MAPGVFCAPLIDHLKKDLNVLGEIFVLVVNHVKFPLQGRVGEGDGLQLSSCHLFPYDVF